MTTETVNKADLLNEIDDTVSELVEVMTSLDEDEVNMIPYKDGWTAGQLFQHITKSTERLSGAMEKEGVAADRDPFEQVNDLKKTFLDFSAKMKSPGFVVPEDDTYVKIDAIKKMGGAFQRLKESIKDKDLSVVVKGSSLGDATKWELLHFVLYHTQRHLHQMKKIHEALRNRIE